MRSLPKELVHLKKNVQARTKQRGYGDIAPVVEQICFFFLQYIIMVIIVMLWKNLWENNNVHLHQWRGFKEFKSPR